MLRVAASYTMVFGLSCFVALACFAGTPQKWSDLPKAVQEVILANGGTKETPVDKEGEEVDGKALYEAQVKDKDGSILDLQITADGKLIDVKTDDSADAAKERVERGKNLLAGVKFSRPARNHESLSAAGLAQTRHPGRQGGQRQDSH